jgi:hypothetical protein
MSTGKDIGTWLGGLLTRLAAGATPIDGTHDASIPSPRRALPRPAVTSRHFGGGCDLAPFPGKTQFVRGLC